MSFPIIGAAPALPVHQYTHSFAASAWSNKGQITITAATHKVPEPVVSVQKSITGGTHRHVTVQRIDVDDTTKDVTVTIPVGNEFAGKIIIN